MEKERALEILRVLAGGVDPFTGEVLPAESPYQQADAVRALSLAIDRLDRWKPRDLPGNAGKPWTVEEEERLVASHGEGRSIREIASAHGRTSGAIESRLTRLGLLEAPR